MTYEARGPQEFKRASIGTYFDADGVLRVAAVDQPRFDHDPVTWQLLGLLVEGERTNLLTHSEFSNGLAGAPTRSGLVTPAAFSGLIGTTGLAIGYDGVTSTYAYKTFSATAGKVYALSVFVRMDDGGVPVPYTSGSTIVPAVDFVLICQGLTPTATAVQDLGGGLYRITATRTASGAVANWGIIKYGTNSARTFKVSGYQLEEGTEASSYIPTTTAPVTRAADLPVFYPATTLLPANASQQERTIELATARIGGVPVPMREQWNPDTCPEHLLPWMAWAFSVDEWSADWPVEAKRQTIRDAVEVQSRKGTPWSIKRVLTNAGYPDAQLQEGRSGFYDGTELHDGSIVYGNPSAWAEYRCVLERPITNSQANQVRRILANTAPARCNLYDFSYVEANNAYNGAIFYDGTFNHGTA